jgi:hypothetical protein
MAAIQTGDQVWCQFVSVNDREQRAWVYPMTVLMITEDGGLVCRDERHDRTRVVDESVENVTRSEAEAWQACQKAFVRIAGECIAKADECRQRAGGEVTCGVA